MKTNTSFEWKLVAKKLATLGLTAALAVSCGGDKKNKVDTNDSNDNNNNPIFGGDGNSQISAMWNQLKSQHGCPQGSRMNDMAFNVQAGQGYGNSISGALQGGHVGGSSQGTFFGMNIGTKDLMAIEKKVDGNNVRYNVVVSLCTWVGQGWSGYGQQQQVEYIGPSANLSNFQLANVVISNTSNCAQGNILDGWLSFTSQTYGGSIPTRFTTVNMNCN